MMSPKQILCIEDEAAIVLPLRYALEREGWNVSWANTGTQALQYLSEQAFDFIILDIGLPDLNGFEVCKQLRQNLKHLYYFLRHEMMKLIELSVWKLAQMIIVQSL